VALALLKSFRQSYETISRPEVGEYLGREGGDARAHADGAQDEIGEGANQKGRIVQCRHYVKIRDARRFGVLASFDIDFVQGFDVVGDEGTGITKRLWEPVRAKVPMVSSSDGWSHFCGPTRLWKHKV
jgi:hypothetical protein